MTSATIPCQDFNLDLLVLRSGAHGNEFHGEACVVEAACVAASCIPDLRERFKPAPFSDDHPSICRVIRSFAISWNDGIRDDETRTRILKPYIVKILGTERGKSVANRRAWMATDWLVRVQTPAWLRLMPSLRPHADALEALGELTGAAAARLAQPALNAARADAAAARAAARAAAWDAAWDAARDAARDAAWDAARDAAWDAAGDAAWDAAGDAARDAAGDAAWDAAGDAAWDAAWDAARDAAGDAAWDAARDAARDALAPTALALQGSACDLLDRMIAEGEVPAAS